MTLQQSAEEIVNSSPSIMRLYRTEYLVQLVKKLKSEHSNVATAATMKILEKLETRISKSDYKQLCDEL